MGKIMYKGQVFQGKIERVESGGGIVYEEDRDYEWDFTRSEHPELDINYGEPILMKNPENIIFSQTGMQIGKMENSTVLSAGVKVPLGNTEAKYWEYPSKLKGKTVELDIVELLAFNKPSLSGSRQSRQMFAWSKALDLTRDTSGAYGFNSNDGTYDWCGYGGTYLAYVRESSPSVSGWKINTGTWSSTLTPETEYYDSIDYFDGKTLKFEFGEKCKIYADNELLYTGNYSGKNYLQYFILQCYHGTLDSQYNSMQGSVLSGARVYKNEWYEPKFQPEQQGGD